MTVSIEVFGQLLPGEERCYTLTTDYTNEDPMKVREAALLLGLKPEEVGLITINGVQSEMDDPVPSDCRLCFFPYMSGG